MRFLIVPHHGKIRLRRVALLALVALSSTALTKVGRAAEFPSEIGLGALNGATGFKLNGVLAGDTSGKSVASAGDVNGDGFSDIIIGAPNADSGAGASYVVFGKATAFASAINLASLNGATGFRLEGAQNYDSSGRSVAAAGDINGDGFGDILIGAPGADPDLHSAAGASYVMFGKTAGFAPVVNLGNLSGATGFRLDGVDPDDQSGISVAAGDVNGDGFADIIVGASLADPSAGFSAGESYVVFGKAASFGPGKDLASLNGTTGFRLDGVAAYDSSGEAVASAGDVNGDGFSDILIGAPDADQDQPLSSKGSSYVVFGKNTSFGSAIDLASLNGANGFRLDGIDFADVSGTSVSSAGDVNGDGFADIFVGALADAGGDSFSGQSYVVFGQGAGFASTFNFAGLDGNNGFALDGIDASDFSGWSVASAGDMNGDGFGDVIVGARLADPGGDSAAGESYVVFGKAAGFPPAIDLSTLDGVTGFRLDGIDVDDGSGQSVASAGDVNGDGFSDVIVGAYQADPGGRANAGESYVVFGRAPDGPRTRIGSAAGQYISGGAFGDTLSALGGNDTLEGRGSADALNGGTGNDTASYLHAVAGIIANLASPGGNTGHAAGDTYNSIENLTGSRLADTLTGNGLANVLNGADGNDTLRGAGGNDILVGGLGQDDQTGSAGADVFKLNRIDESQPGALLRDKIRAFEAGTSSTSVDKIDLRPIDARTNIAGNQAFTFIGTSPFSGVSGQIRISLSGSTTIVSGDVNGDSAADFQIGLLNFTNLANLNSGDFLK